MLLNNNYFIMLNMILDYINCIQYAEYVLGTLAYVCVEACCWKYVYESNVTLPSEVTPVCVYPIRCWWHLLKCTSPKPSIHIYWFQIGSITSCKITLASTCPHISYTTYNPQNFQISFKILK